MKTNVKSVLKLAIFTGFVAGTASKALADHHEKKDAGDKAHAEKSGCNGPNGCSGNCSGKDDKMGKMKMHGKAHQCEGKSCMEHGNPEHAADHAKDDHTDKDADDHATTTTTEKKK